jgi:hypothetical protein
VDWINMTEMINNRKKQTGGPRQMDVSSQYNLKTKQSEKVWHSSQ